MAYGDQRPNMQSITFSNLYSSCMSNHYDLHHFILLSFLRHETCWFCFDAVLIISHCFWGRSISLQFNTYLPYSYDHIVRSCYFCTSLPPWCLFFPCMHASLSCSLAPPPFFFLLTFASFNTVAAAAMAASVSYFWSNSTVESHKKNGSVVCTSY